MARDYEALKVAREAAAARTREVIARAARRRATDPIVPPPSGFRYIDTAPYDGTFLRLRFRPGLGREDLEVVGAWRLDSDLPAGGFWSDRAGNYITPGPLFWAPEIGLVN